MTNTTLEKWEEKTLGEVCEILDSRRKPITKKDRISGVYPYYGATGILDYVSGWIFDEGLVLLGEDGAKWTSGEQSAFKISGKTWVNNHAHVLRPNKDKISDIYLIYNLNFQNLMPYITGTTVPKLNQEKMRSISIPLPPLSEQERIVAKLDKAFEAIDKVKANAEQNLNNAKELLESALNNAFTENTEGWEEKTLGSISDLKQNKAEVKNIDANTLVSFVPMEYLGINQKYFNSNQSKPIKNLIENYTYFAENDVIMAKITPCFENGKIGIARGLTNKIGFGSSEYIVFRTNKDINREYLYYFLNRGTFRKEGAQNMLGAVGHKRVSKEFIENYPFSYPSLPEQQKIVEKLDALQQQTKQLEQIYTKKIKECDELKQSILQKAFRGEL